jgi:glycosyltransferase involved in cell wall biosynthesis
VVRVGFDLSSFVVDDDERARRRGALRRELGIPDDARVVTTVARLVPIKRVDRFLRMAAALGDEPAIRFVVVGDGELREQLQGSPEALSLGDALVWTGFRSDMPDLYFASDVVVQTSDNEGTPVALIEAQAAGVPVVSTRVGGVATVVEDGVTGRIVEVAGEEELAGGVRTALDALSADAGARGRDRAVAMFDIARLIADVDRVYKDVLDRS